MIKSNRHRSEKTVEIDQAVPVCGVDQIGAAAFFQIDNDFESIEQNMLAQRIQDMRWRNRLAIFTFAQTRPRRASRLGEHGRHTHPLRVAFAAELVNRTRMASYFLCAGAACESCASSGQIAFCSPIALASAALYSAT